MKTFTRHLLWNNMLIMGICLLTCTGIYLLVDVFDRLDRMLEKGGAAWEILVYFGAKIPLILSEILPAVVFLSLVIQIAGMRKRRETTALEAGGVSYFRLVCTVLVLGLVWSGVQLGFSQGLGVQGQQVSDAVWDSLGGREEKTQERINDLWLRSGQTVLHMEAVWPARQEARGLTLYAVDQGFTEIDRLIQAEALRAGDGGWQLQEAEVLDPQSFAYSTEETLSPDLELSFQSVQVSQEDNEPEDMSLWELRAHIERLKDSGANVELLRTAWHLKISYAASVLVLSAVALVLTRKWENLFASIGCGLGIIFGMLSMHTLGGTLGESGALPPWLGAWMGNLLIGGLTALGLGIQIRGRVT
ncbi:LptF/LptG family permease [Desulfovermiculus halophilus]|uniref:LptF/LptG family permease n=1 Tax=Desulfovermiculus halophilus TaxID=339722 RepID=UPI000688A30C|nr:LptF/LptG family permease [Desulfovermiculus halophilus]